MAERIVSPGVFSREQDLSFLAPEAQEAGTAFVGPTVKGPAFRPRVVTSFSEYKNIFGTTFKVAGEEKEYLTSIAVKNFFSQGGQSALITRILDSATPAESSPIACGSSTVTIADLISFKTLAEGTDQNSGTATVGTNEKYLVGGTADNIRVEIADVDATTATFTVLVRRGDDNDLQKTVLETFAGVTLDPTSANYIKRRIGDKEIRFDGTNYVESGAFNNVSNYIVVSGIDSTAALELAGGYFDQTGAIKDDSNGDPLSEYLPAETTVVGFVNGAGAASSSPELFHMIGAVSTTECQGVAVTGYTKAFTSILSNKDEYKFSVIAAPGLLYDAFPAQVNEMIALAENRGDCIAVVDLGKYSASIADVVEDAKALNSSFAAAYFPWLEVVTDYGQKAFVPASTVIPGVYAFTDQVAAPWFAPAGLVRGGIPGVLRASTKLSRANRDSLYRNKVNPIATFPGQGIAVFGQKTLQTKASALDRVNVRRLLIELKDFLGNQGRNLVFEQNTIATRNRFLAAVNPYLESVVQRQGLYAYRVVMDDTNNTADIVDRNQLVGQIYIQPAKTAEFVVLDFIVEPTGATFGA